MHSITADVIGFNKDHLLEEEYVKVLKDIASNIQLANWQRGENGREYQFDRIDYAVNNHHELISVYMAEITQKAFINEVLGNEKAEQLKQIIRRIVNGSNNRTHASRQEEDISSPVSDKADTGTATTAQSNTTRTTASSNSRRSQQDNQSNDTDTDTKQGTRPRQYTVLGLIKSVNKLNVAKELGDFYDLLTKKVNKSNKDLTFTVTKLGKLLKIYQTYQEDWSTF